MMRWSLALILCVCPVMVVAEGLPQLVILQVERNADKYLDDLGVIIASYGTAGAIDGPGLRNMVAMARAEARAMALRRLQGADLDGDGSIAGAELRVTMAAAAAAARGRLSVYFGNADGNGDDLVTAVELQAYANMVAEKSFSQDKAAAVYAILGFDGNGDGRVTLAEARAAVEMVASAHRGQEIDDQFQIEGDDHKGDHDGQRDQPARGGQGPHLLPVGGKHDKGDHGKTQL
jgi:hypothetical protein